MHLEAETACNLTMVNLGIAVGVPLALLGLVILGVVLGLLYWKWRQRRKVMNLELQFHCIFFFVNIVFSGIAIQDEIHKFA